MSEIPTGIGHDEMGTSGDEAGFFVPDTDNIIRLADERRARRPSQLPPEVLRNIIQQSMQEGSVGFTEETFSLDDDATALQLFMATYVRHPSYADKKGNYLGEKLREQFGANDGLGNALRRMVEMPTESSDYLETRKPAEDEVLLAIEQALRSSIDNANDLADSRWVLRRLIELRWYVVESAKPELKNGDEDWHTLIDRLITL